ncbi:MAG: 3-hydroxyacyl-CoA dehydrogenase/enoyl-CoA hydratase family protein [Planctomycetota bacterium]
MAFEFRGRTFSKIGIVGSGQIGPDIALHFTKVFAPHGTAVVVQDISEEALERGRTKLTGKIQKGRESGAFKPEQADAMIANVTFTADARDLADCDFIVEAATEDVGIKDKIFQSLAKITRPGTIFASNSSHLEPGEIFANVVDPSRSLVIHYFFPAERNPAVEIVPSEETDRALVSDLMHLYEAIGKVPIEVGSRYGYAIDPIFEGLFFAAARAVENGLGTVKEVDAAAARALGLGVGPFTAMNLTGGNPITGHGLEQYHSRIHEGFHPPKILKDALESGQPWEVAGRGEKVELPDEQEAAIRRWMRGAYFQLFGEVIDSGISNVSDLEMAVEIALVIQPPCAMMNEIGIPLAFSMVEEFCEKNDGFPVPVCIKKQMAAGRPWTVPVIQRWMEGDVAVLKIRRPRVLNALDAEVFRQLQQHFGELEKDDAVRAIVLTGFGVKAFVSGADVHFLAEIDSPAAGEENSLGSQAVLDTIEECSKPVICAMNGLAFGGGNELAMACDARLARAGLKVFAAQPEPNLGILPGAGGTQRLPRLIGIEQAAPLLRTGRPISSSRAVELGLVLREVQGDIVQEAVQLARDVATGKVTLEKMPTGPLSDVPDQLPEQDIGHLSRAVDALICRAILEGARLPLKEGLKLEAKLFGEVCGLEDMKIGVRNFIENGPRSQAPFVHR